MNGGLALAAALRPPPIRKSRVVHYQSSNQLRLHRMLSSTTCRDELCSVRQDGRGPDTDVYKQVRKCLHHCSAEHMEAQSEMSVLCVLAHPMCGCVSPWEGQALSFLPWHWTSVGLLCPALPLAPVALPSQQKGPQSVCFLLSAMASFLQDITYVRVLAICAFPACFQVESLMNTWITISISGVCTSSQHL